MLMLVKHKEYSFTALCVPAEVAGCRAGGNPSVLARRPKQTGVLAEEGRQEVLLCVRHWNKQTRLVGIASITHCLDGQS